MSLSVGEMARGRGERVWKQEEPAQKHQPFRCKEEEEPERRLGERSQEQLLKLATEAENSPEKGQLPGGARGDWEGMGSPGWAWARLEK